MEDAALVESIRAGNEEAWTVLVRRHSDLVWRVARSVVNDDDSATDAMQVTWLRLLENVDRIKNPQAVRGWLATTARREAIALSKKLTRQRPDDPVVLDISDRQHQLNGDGAPDPSSLVADNDEVTLLLSELDRLGEKCRTLLTLYANNVSYSEIAEILDIAPGGVSPSRARCLEQLRRSPRLAHLDRAQTTKPNTDAGATDASVSGKDGS